MHLDPHPSALDVLPRGYSALFRRLLAHVLPDERWRAMWLSGSLGRGVADAGSDLDIILAIRDEDHEEFVRTWRDWLAGITPTLIAGPIGNFHGFYSTTEECLRLDVVVEPVGRVAESGHRYRSVVFDRDGLDAHVPDPGPAEGPDTERIARLMEESFRQQAIFPAVLARADWLLGVEGVHNQRTLLYDLMVEANRPLPPMGVKQWSAKLTAEQRDVFTALPPLAATSESVIAGMRAILEAFRTVGRSCAESVGVPWPDRLDRSVSAFLRREVPGWS